MPPTYSRQRCGPCQPNGDTRYTSPLCYPPGSEPVKKTPGLARVPRARPQQTSPTPSVQHKKKPSGSSRTTRGEMQPSASPGARVRESLLISTTTAGPDRKPEPPLATSRTPPFTTTQFHVLLNSLFKVLFNFPSRYLFAIGLGVVFSLTRSLPRALSCTLKQLDSGEKVGAAQQPSHGPITLSGLWPQSRWTWTGRRTARRLSLTQHSARPSGDRQFCAGLLPFHSPLLRESLLFSFPPLINMLKFSG